MDQSHLRILKAIEPAGATASLALFLEHSANWRGEDVPDPYYGGGGGFEAVLDRVEEASARLLDAVIGSMER
jgi:protein-tyrosine phosphatase